MSPTYARKRFDRGAWWHLSLMTALLLLAIGSTIYRLTLPTDGWLSVEPDEFDSYGYIYVQDIMGSAGGLQPDDHLIAVEDISLATTPLTALWQLRDDWQAGNSVRYTIRRDEMEIPVAVPLVKWDLSRLFQTTLDSVTLAGLLGVVVFMIVSFLAFWRRPQVPAARALLVLSTSIVSAFIVVDFLPFSIIDEIFPIATIVGFGIITLTFTVLLPPAFIRFALVFPKPVPALERYPWIASLPLAIGVIGIGAFLLQFFTFGWVWTASSVLIAVGILIHNAVTMRDAVSRAQLRWGLGGMLLGLGLFALTYIGVFFEVSDAVSELLASVSSLSFMVMGVALGIAVLRYRLFDIDLIIRKSLQYGALTAILALVYFGSVLLLQALFGQMMSNEQSPLVIVLSTLLIAALFNPLRQRIQETIDRRFFRRKYDAQQVLAQFAQTARDETDLNPLIAELRRVVGETLQPEGMSIWLKGESR